MTENINNQNLTIGYQPSCIFRGLLLLSGWNQGLEFSSANFASNRRLSSLVCDGLGEGVSMSFKSPKKNTWNIVPNTIQAFLNNELFIRSLP